LAPFAPAVTGHLLSVVMWRFPPERADQSAGIPWLLLF